MLLFENIRMAISGLLANKMRAILTMLGIIIGIGSVIGIKSIGDSISSTVTDSMSGLGASNVTISLTTKSEDNTSDGNFLMFARSSPSDEDLITDEMIEEYKDIFSEYVVYTYTTSSFGTATIGYGDDEYSVNMTGVSEEYIEANDIDILAGRRLKTRDYDGEKKVAVISSALAGALFTMQDPVGQELEISVNNKYYTFYVAGVFDDTDNDDSSKTTAYIPITTAQVLSGSTSAGYQSFTAITENVPDMDAYLDATDEYFSEVYASNSSYTATSSSLSELVSTLTDMVDTISLAISAIAAISLLVGGIGVMNIMLVSVTERTREIGTRKALGATNSSIRTQFIVESVVICIIGGAIGIALGYGIGAAAAKIAGINVTVSFSAISVAVGFSMAIGVFFGYYPANKAAKLDPIEALRYE